MENIKTTQINVEPYFDLEEFMNFSKESRLDNETYERLSALWEDWLPKLNVYRLESKNNSWLAIWLPEEVENFVDQAWNESPAQGYLINNLAQFVCMSTVEELLPQVANGGCAPAPKPSEDMENALSESGIAYDSNRMLSRRYAIITYYPFKGGCEICNLASACPKHNGAEGYSSVVLPGYERE